jgi:hypothetical protein
MSGPRGLLLSIIVSADSLATMADAQQAQSRRIVDAILKLHVHA